MVDIKTMSKGEMRSKIFAHEEWIKELLAELMASREYARALKGLVDSAVDVLARHAPPGGPGQAKTISALYSIFDGPEYRAALAKNPADHADGAATATRSENGVSRTDPLATPGSAGPDAVNAVGLSPSTRHAGVVESMLERIYTYAAMGIGMGAGGDALENFEAIRHATEIALREFGREVSVTFTRSEEGR